MNDNATDQPAAIPRANVLGVGVSSISLPQAVSAIDEALRPLIGNRIYGCDDCQLACPWNKFAQLSPLPDWQAREGLGAGRIAELMNWNEAEFLRRTEGSAIRRIGHARWLRNLALAAGNALASTALPEAERQVLLLALYSHAAHPDLVVQEQVAWSLARA